MLLCLTLTRKWFDLIKAGVKPEEYREIKPYWINRLCWHEYHTCTPEEIIKLGSVAIKSRYYSDVLFRNGYSADSPIIEAGINRITIRTGKPEWGAEPGKLYFVIELNQVV